VTWGSPTPTSEIFLFQAPAQDKEIKSAIIAGLVIREEFGKICGSQLISLGGRDWGFMILECFKKIYQSLPHQT
jgi:hypothetical protein